MSTHPDEPTPEEQRRIDLYELARDEEADDDQYDRLEDREQESPWDR